MENVLLLLLISVSKKNRESAAEDDYRICKDICVSLFKNVFDEVLPVPDSKFDFTRGLWDPVHAITGNVLLRPLHAVTWSVLN